MASIVERAKDIPVVADVDVCVVGGGPTGLAAAVAAGRQGADVMLVEMQGCLGGMATSGLIGPILGHTAYGTGEPALGGIPKEVCTRMADMGYAVPWEESLTQFGVSFNSEAMKILADRMVQEENIDVMFHTFFTDCMTEDGCVTHAIVENKSGRQAIAADLFIDATGDADVAARAGAEITKGRPADGRPMAMGSMFHVGGLDTIDDEVRKELQEKTKEKIADGEFNLYNHRSMGTGSSHAKNAAACNMTRAEGNPADVEDLTRAEFEIRDLTWRVVQFWKSVAGAEDLYLQQTPAHVGIRESRQVVGEYRITGEDVANGTRYDDSIARCGYWIDIHCPRGLVEGGNVHLCKAQCESEDCYMLDEYADQLPEELHPPEGGWFDIPYRTLVPRDTDGLLVGGRCISADYQAMGAMRVMGPCMATGEAAGIAAAMAVDGGIQPRNVEIDELRDTLTECGALV